MAITIQGDLSTRESFVETIRKAGNYIADHAENILGDYRSLLSELRVTAVFDYQSPAYIDVQRRHFVCSADEYPTESESDEAMQLLRLSARQLEHRDCQRGCLHYDEERGALRCPHLYPRDNGVVC